MSIYDKASLVLIPSGTKTSKVYSQKPTNGDGDFTFSRSTAATRVNASGNIEKERTNYVRWSQDLTNWGAFGGTTLTTGVTDPNGGSNAATISNIGAGNLNQGAYLVDNPMTISAGNVVCQSMYLKGSGTIAIAIERAIAGTYWIYHKVVTLTSEWQRFEQFVQIPTAASGFTFYVINASGTTATSVDIAFAQLEFGTAATDFIVTNGSAVTTGITDNVPRLDYTDSSCPALLLEPQRTNGFSHSEYFDGLSLDVVSISYNATSPENLTNAATLTATGNFPKVRAYPPLSDNTKYCISVFVKSGTASVFGILAKAKDNSVVYHIECDSSDGSTTSVANTPSDSGSVNYGNGWYRFYMVYDSLTGATGSPEVRLLNHRSTSDNGWTDGLTILAYGGMHEAGSYATSYIPTYGSAVTRNQDTGSIPSASSLIGQTEGTLFLKFKHTNEAVGLVGINAGNIGNRLYIGTDTNGLISQVRVSYSTQAFFDTSLTIGTTYKCALAYKENDFVLYVNGSQIGVDTNGLVPSSLSRIAFQQANGNDSMPQPLNEVLVFKTRLTNAELATLTTI